MSDHLDLEAIKRDLEEGGSAYDHVWPLISEVERQDAIIRASERGTEVIRLVQQRDDARAEVERLRADVERKDEALRDVAEMRGIPPGWEHVDPDDYPGGIEDAAWSCMDDYYVHRENMRRIARVALSGLPTETKGENG